MTDASALERTLQQLRALNTELQHRLEREGALLAETTERLRTLFENAPLSIQLIHPSGRTLQVNAAWKELWGIPDALVESFILKEYNILEDPQLEQKGIAPYFRRALEGENCHIPAARYDPAELGVAGRARWVEGFLYPVKDASARVHQLVLIHWDVTRDREAQALLLRKSAEFESIFEHLPEPVIMGTVDRRIAQVNPAASALLGYTPAELVGQPVSLIYASHEDYLRVGEQRHNPQSTAFGAATYEMKYRHKNGELILSQTTTTVMRAPDGTVFGYVGIIRDIREQRREEEMRKFISDAGDVLASSLDDAETLSALARLAVPTLADWCFIDLLEDDGSVRRAEVVISDPKYAAVREDVVRFKPRREYRDHPPSRALFESTPLLIPVIDRARIERMAQNDEHARIIAGTGVHSMMCVPLVARNRTLGVLTLMLEGGRRSYTDRDLSYAKQFAHKAAQAVENSRLYRHAVEAISARDEFLSICSHELKTPLTSMKLQLQLLTQPQAPQKRLEVCHRQLRRLERLIDDMLDVSRIATGKMTMSMEALSLREVMNESAEQAQERFHASGVLLQVEAGEDVQIRGDRLRLIQVLDNLLSNALKYGNGSPVRLCLSHQGQQAQVSVEDKGPGIPAENLQRIFQRFERVSPSNGISGLGLGLYISRQIAEAHGGHLEAQSELGRGARFTLELPCDL